MEKNIIKFNYSIAKKTWFGTGGKCLIYFQPKSIEQLKIFVKFLPRYIKIFPLGLGSNILLRDGGFKGVVIKLGKFFSEIEYLKKEKKIIVGAGVKDISLANFCMKKSISGFEFLVGIPGTIGGAIKMNSGCFGSEIIDNLISITVLDRNGVISTFEKKDIKFEYRKSNIANESIILNATFKTKNSESNIINNKMKKFSEIRKKNQPVAVRTGGSTFKNTNNKKAWKLINLSGMRERSVGDAKVSEKHSNFLINKGNASSLDIELLGEEILYNVLKKTGVKLNWEIERVGEFEKI